MKSRTPEVYSNFLMSRFYFSVYMCVFLKNLLNYPVHQKPDRPCFPQKVIPCKCPALIKVPVVVLIIFHLSGVSGSSIRPSFNTTPFESMNFIKTGIGFPVVFIYLKRSAYTCANPVEIFHSMLLLFPLPKNTPICLRCSFFWNLPFSTAISAPYDILTRVFLSSGSNSFRVFPSLLYPPFPQLQPDAGNICRFQF